MGATKIEYVKMPEPNGRVWDQMPEGMVEVLESAERSA